MGERRCCWYLCDLLQHTLILCVAGVLVDMNQRKMSFTLDGIYTEPMGVAFESFSYSGGLMPGLTCNPGVPLMFEM
jgi:hypothetical protein